MSIKWYHNALVIMILNEITQTNTIGTPFSQTRAGPQWLSKDVMIKINYVELEIVRIEQTKKAWMHYLYVARPTWHLICYQEKFAYGN